MITNKLKHIRMSEYEMNQKEFAEFLGIDYKKYNHYELSTTPSAETMFIISKKLNRPIEQIFSLVEND